MSSQYQVHRQKWGNCTRCLLCKRRKNVVLARGKIPAQILFVGEAPGDSEDVLGYPFVGPAGHLLNRIIEAGIDGQYDYALTNLVACIPKDEMSKKAGEPPEEAVTACSPRLQEIIQLVNPRLIVTVGKLADKWVVRLPNIDAKVQWASLIHPAAILRADISQRGLAIQRSVVALTDAVVALEGI